MREGRWHAGSRALRFGLNAQYRRHGRLLGTGQRIASQSSQAYRRQECGTDFQALGRIHIIHISIMSAKHHVGTKPNIGRAVATRRTVEKLSRARIMTYYEGSARLQY